MQKLYTNAYMVNTVRREPSSLLILKIIDKVEVTMCEQNI